MGGHKPVLIQSHPLTLHLPSHVLVVSRLKSVEAIKLEFVAPMPEQIATTTMKFLQVTEKLCKSCAKDLGRFWLGHI